MPPDILSFSKNFYMLECLGIEPRMVWNASAGDLGGLGAGNHFH